MKTNGWEVTNQAAYSDSVTGKNRTIDMIAEKNIVMKTGKIGLDIWLFIECKKISKPWVFYVSDN